MIWRPVTSSSQHQQSPAGPMQHKRWKRGTSPVVVFLVICVCLMLLFLEAVRTTGSSTSRVTVTTGPIHTINNTTQQLLAAVVQHDSKLEQLLQQMVALNKSVHEAVHKPKVQQHSDKQQQLDVHHSLQQQQRQSFQGPVSVVAPPFAAHHTARAKAACDTAGGPGLQIQHTADLVAPVVIVAHDRVHYLAKCLMTVLRFWSEDDSNAKKFPLFVSIDGGHPSTTFFAGALHHAANVQVIHNLRDPNRCPPKEGYCNLSLHYQMLLQLFFECHKVPRLLFLEEDLQVAPDFFSYFSALAPLLEQDPSIWCISAWNDLGQRGRASNATTLLRTDILPGLGWMLSARVGNELWPQWPNKYWDDWLREPNIRKGRQCVFPEVSRTHTFGSEGTSMGILFNSHLSTMLLNNERVDWSKQGISYLQKDSYDQLMQDWVADAEVLERSALEAFCRIDQPTDSSSQDLLVRYTSIQDYSSVAKLLPPMLPDVKGGQPRSSYNGTSMVRCRGRRLFIAPQPSS